MAYASSYATSSPISSLSTPFPSCNSTLPFALRPSPFSCPLPLLSFSLVLPQSSHFHRNRVISLHLTLCSDFLPFSTKCTRCPLILSLPSMRVHRRSFFFAHSSPSQQPFSSRPFSHFYIRAKPYPKNNPFHAVYDLYTYVSEEGSGRRGNTVYGYGQPTEINILSVIVFLLRRHFCRSPSLRGNY